MIEDEQQQQNAAVFMIASIGVVIEESIRVREQLTALGFREDQLLAVLEAAEVIDRVKQHG